MYQVRSTKESEKVILGVNLEEVNDGNVASERDRG